MKKPAVSIITVCLNNKTGLEKTIRSVAEQTFQDFEFIIIDGGSTDRSIDVINKYASDISYWISEKDSGIYNAMNKGIARALGEYCLFLNSGDFLVDKNVLMKVFRSLPVDDIVYGDMIIDYGNDKSEYGKQPDKINFEFLIQHTLWHPVTFIKRELFAKFGLYNEKNRIVSDYEFFLRTVIIEQVSTKHIPIPVAVFNTSGIGSSKEFEELHKKEKRAVQEKLFSKEIIDSVMRLSSKSNSSIELIEPAYKYPQIKKVLIFIGNTLIRIRRQMK